MINEFAGKVIADKYRVDELITETDLGTFYRGWHVLMDRPVIIKVLSTALAVDTRLVDRFVAEAKVESHVSHPNVLTLHDFGTDTKGIAYVVYQDAPGQMLSDLLRSGEQLPVDRAVSIAANVAAGLAAAHENGLVHGTVGPERVLVENDGDRASATIFAFGSEPVGKQSLADVRYLAPEQYDDVSNADERSDVYSLGAVLYEMLAGRRHYEGDSIRELIDRQETEPPPPLSAFRDDLPDDLEPMVLSAIALDPDRRYGSMSAFADDLSMLHQSMNSSAASKAPVAPTARKHNIWQTAFIVLAGISVLAVALIYATSNKKTDPTTQLQADAGSLPVQPIGPATGAQEDQLSKLPPMTDAEILSQANSAQAMDSLPGGDGYNPWAGGVQPPPGAPPAQYVPPGGQYYTIDPNGGSQFMPNEGGVVLVPLPVNTNTAPKVTPTPKGTPADAGVKPTPENTPAKPLATPVEKQPAGVPAKPNSTPKSKSGKQTDS